MLLLSILYWLVRWLLGLSARAHHGLAHIHHTTGDLDQARHHWQQARTLYTDLGVPDADDVRAHLTTLDQTLQCTDRRTHDDHPGRRE